MEPLICLTTVCHKDIEQAKLWLRWTGWLAARARAHQQIVVFLSQRAAAALPELEAVMRGAIEGGAKLGYRPVICPDELETGYPRSASHLFLRGLELCETAFPGSPVLYCEPDTTAIHPDWIEDIAREYRRAGRAFMGQRIWHQGGKTSHCTGNAVYPPNWRVKAPSLATVLEAPDTRLWGEGKGQPWDVWAADETVADMHETRLIQQIFTCPPWNAGNMNRLQSETALFHRCKDGTLVVELARSRFPEFLETLAPAESYYQMAGHPSRLKILGYDVADWKAARRPAGWLSTGRARTAADQIILECLAGTKGIVRAPAAQLAPG